MEGPPVIGVRAQRPRALLFVHDGTSLGHLRRISRIAEAMQGSFACLIMTGMREAHYIVPKSCELLTLPSWDGLILHRANRSGRDPWWRESKDTSVRLRSELIQSVVATFDPDLLVVDYLPFGQYGELKRGLAATRAIKYFLLRGVVDTSDLQMLGGASIEAIATTFHRIILAVDDKVLDVLGTYHIASIAQSKCIYVGYVAPLPRRRDVIRQRHYVMANQQWVVCSAGGGRGADAFVHRCTELGRLLPMARFDVVIGPMSTVDRRDLCNVPPNCRVHVYCDDLAEMNSAADVVVCGGGYNTVCEAIGGGAHIVAYPNQTGDSDEQRVHAALLSQHYPLDLAPDLDSIAGRIVTALNRVRDHGRPTHRLNLAGAQNIARIANADVGSTNR